MLRKEKHQPAASHGLVYRAACLSRRCIALGMLRLLHTYQSMVLLAFVRYVLQMFRNKHASCYSLLKGEAGHKECANPIFRHLAATALHRPELCLHIWMHASLHRRPANEHTPDHELQTDWIDLCLMETSCNGKFQRLALLLCAQTCDTFST